MGKDLRDPAKFVFSEMIFVLLLFSLVVHIKNSGICKGINAQLNSVFDQTSSNLVRSLGTHNEKDVLFLVQTQEKDSMDPEFSIWNAIMVYNPMDIVSKKVVLSQEHINTFALEGQNASLYSLSNMVNQYIKRGENEAKYIGVGVCTLLLSVDEESCDSTDEKLSELYFFPMFSDDKEVILERATEERKLQSYFYPFDDAQPIYNITGGIVSHERKKNLGLISDNLDRKILQIDIEVMNTTTSTVNHVWFVAMIYTQGSLKVVKYNYPNVPNPNSVITADKSKMLMPSIINGETKSDTDFNFNSFYSARLVTDEKRDRVFVIATLSREQAQVFANFHGQKFKLEFKNGQDISIFVFVIDYLDLEILDVINVMEKTEKTVKKYLLTDVDYLSGHLIISGANFFSNQFGIPEKIEDGEEYYSFISHVNILSDPVYVNSTLGFNDIAKDYSEFTDKDWNFNLLTASFPENLDTSSVVLGGSFFSQAGSTSVFRGRSYSLNLLSGKPVTETKVGLDDKANNILLQIYRYGHKVYFAILENIAGKEKNKSDVWVVDCTVPSAALELASKIVFFVLVGLSMLSFVFATTYFIGKAIYQARKRKGNEETDPLL